jgi:zinc transport system ATP-binding protein
MNPILSASNLGVSFDGKSLFEGLNFELEEGKTLAILGPNGAGKTVLLRSLLGLQDCKGEIRWRAGVRLGYVPQRVPLNRELPITVSDFFSLKSGPRVDVPQALAAVGISEERFGSKQLGFLSTGQFQRVLMAWALASSPDVLLVDEPMAGVDLGGEETIYSLLSHTQAHSRLSIVLVTHDLSVVPDLAHRVLCIGTHKACFGPPTELLTPEVLRGIFGSEAKFFEHHHD